MGHIGLVWIVFGAIALIRFAVQANLKRKFSEYSQELLGNGMSGKDIAEKMLRDHGITDVSVISTAGQLTDHYNPLQKTVNLSEEVYFGQSIMSAAVAAHECGHAVQHARAYGPLTLRSKLVPIVSFSSQWITWVLLIGIITIQTFPQLMLLGIIMFGMTTLFSFVTLPVEIDASKRALVWLRGAGVTTNFNQPKAASALRAAAYTYVVAALSSLATLIYYILIFLGRRN